MIQNNIIFHKDNNDQRLFKNQYTKEIKSKKIYVKAVPKERTIEVI